MRNAPIVALLGACVAASGCTTPPAGTGPVPSPASIPVAQVISQLKVELAAFAAAVKANPITVGCGGQTAQLKMSITNVEADLSASLATSGNGNISATVPVSLVTVGPSGSGTLSSDNSETVSLNFTPTDLVGLASAPDSSQMNLTNALIALRNQIPAVSPSGQCLDFSISKDQTIKLAFSATKDLSGGIKFTILVLSIGATVDSKTTNANTLTVTFKITDQKGNPIAPEAPPRPINRRS